jgi:lipopolysaccharide/colanic/teichoic acid biosynthesis glycosyltransferase
MEKNYKEKLKILHLGADPEFLSPVNYENYLVEIDTMDNPFSVSQWITTNGLPDALICEKNLPGGTAFGFYDFWVDQFDSKKIIPFILLDEEKNQETDSMAQLKNIEEIYIKPTSAEVLISRILILLKDKSLPNNEIVSEMNAFKPYKPTFLKRTFDIVTASIGLLIVSPILLICVIAIRLESKGKVFYTSKRVGSGYKVFDFYKLRSMHINADKRLKELANLNELTKESPIAHSGNLKQDRQSTSNPIHGNNSTLIGDPRITKVGKIMRKMDIDELPQLYNVIKGDISMVGNRPLPIYEAELLTTNDWADRFRSPAGITGIWKVVTRRKLRSMSHEERNSLQNKYSQIANSSTSFWKDIWIIIQTFPAAFRKENVVE